MVRFLARKKGKYRGRKNGKFFGWKKGESLSGDSFINSVHPPRLFTTMEERHITVESVNFVDFARKAGIWLVTNTTSFRQAFSIKRRPRTPG